MMAPFSLRTLYVLSCGGSQCRQDPKYWSSAIEINAAMTYRARRDRIWSILLASMMNLIWRSLISIFSMVLNRRITF
ncbi:hypothetical protein ARMGADRAFT_264025 [Armillaria gallica]|uniref:Uncharacterized protein n=1 Tax=Armillaria gallica TaxID=47427 RepID=A0A2H3E5B4_ARMGA|nr:hypothetical protein ARMGADRAFT_264025 [Armillaria gallica]